MRTSHVEHVPSLLCNMTDDVLQFRDLRSNEGMAIAVAAVRALTEVLKSSTGACARACCAPQGRAFSWEMKLQQ